MQAQLLNLRRAPARQDLLEHFQVTLKLYTQLLQ